MILQIAILSVPPAIHESQDGPPRDRRRAIPVLDPEPRKRGGDQGRAGSDHPFENEMLLAQQMALTVEGNLSPKQIEFCQIHPG